MKLHKQIQRDRVTIFNLPENSHARIKEACMRGLRNARRVLAVQDPLDILILFDPAEEQENAGFRSRGGSLSTSALYVNINSRRPFTEKRLHELESTIAHEYLHCLRWDIRIKTLLDNFINEGLSCYLQAYLYEEPSYLDLADTHIEDLCKWWKWWRGPYLSKSFTSSIAERFLANRATREGGYRIGYYIVTSFLDTHPEVTLRDFVTIRYAGMRKFALSLFRK